jgi:hypothetical protein
MEAPAKALPLDDPPTRRKDKDKKNKKNAKAKDEAVIMEGKQQHKGKKSKHKKGKEKKDKPRKNNIIVASNAAEGLVPASATQRKESTASTPATQGSSSEEHLDGNAPHLQAS